jgi:SAM-dependent methyltransferase
MMTLDQNVHGRALRLLDWIFPPNSRAFMSAEQQTTHEVTKASETMGGYLAELGTSRTHNLDVLDFGCGWGGETLWLADRVHSVCGVDVDQNAVGQARKTSEASAVSNCRFEWSEDGRLPFADASFDAVLSTDTFEHVMDLNLAFREIYRVLRPGGSLLTRFGPLFYSPHGYHLYWACQVPYAHLLFGLDAIAMMRARRGGSRAHPASWQDLGLNGKRFGEYYRSVRSAGFDIIRFKAIPVRRTAALAMLPVVKDLFISGVDCHVRRPA